MSGRNKHRTANDYLQYLKGELSGQERHAFEREMEGDPFEKEAMEGLEMLTAEEAEKDLLTLHARMRKRKSRKRRIAWYSIAATVGSLLIVGTLFFQIYDLNPDRPEEKMDQEIHLPGNEKIAKGDETGETAPKVDAKITPIESQVEAPEESPVETPEENANRAQDGVNVETPVNLADKDAKPSGTGTEARTGKAATGGVSKGSEIDRRDSREPTKPEPVTLVEAEPSPGNGDYMMDLADSEAEAAPAREEMVAKEMVAEETVGKSKKTGNAVLQPVAGQPSMMEQEVYTMKEAGRPFNDPFTGVVLSGEDLKPMPGVAITVKGTNMGAVTNRDGYFTIPAQDDSNKTMVASFVGMKPQEFEYGNERNVQLVMQPDQQTMDEVVLFDQGVQPMIIQGVDHQEGKVTLQDDAGSGPALPSGGYEEFKKYIEENIEFPPVKTTSDREVVFLAFTVTTSGTISNIMALKSPGAPFTKEAIRLVKEGPSWDPAFNRKGKIEEIVRLRIVFKK